MKKVSRLGKKMKFMISESGGRAFIRVMTCLEVSRS